MFFNVWDKARENFNCKVKLTLNLCICTLIVVFDLTLIQIFIYKVIIYDVLNLFFSVIKLDPLWKKIFLITRALTLFDMFRVSSFLITIVVQIFIHTFVILQITVVDKKKRRILIY